MELLTALTLSMGVSVHVGLDNEYNETHPHIRYQNEQFITGVYYNSENKISMYGGYRLEPKQNFGVEFAIVSGYDHFGPAAPFVRGTYDIDSNVRVFVSPVAEKNGDETNAGIVFGVEIKIK